MPENVKIDTSFITCCKKTMENSHTRLSGNYSRYMTTDERVAYENIRIMYFQMVSTLEQVNSTKYITPQK